MLALSDLSLINKIAPFRNKRLFEEFLPTGYKLTTLSSVREIEKVVEIKTSLGTLITLYDDFADRPDCYNPGLLKTLYRLPFEELSVQKEFLSTKERRALELARSLIKQLKEGINSMPNGVNLLSFFKFDLKQFFLANQYSELLTESPELTNTVENKLYLHHNMGIVMAGMIDLMSLEKFDRSELGQCRSLFLLGQRVGRIANVLSTYEREKKEGDNTNELFSLKGKRRKLKAELKYLYEQMKNYDFLQSFSAEKYLEGIKSLQKLHSNFKGII